MAGSMAAATTCSWLATASTSPRLGSLSTPTRPSSSRHHVQMLSAGRSRQGRHSWQRRQASQRASRGERVPTAQGRRVTSMAIKAIDNFSGDFDLMPENRQALIELLASDSFCHQVLLQPSVAEAVSAGSTAEADGQVTVRFTGMLFQPVPWSMNTKHGMPAEYEPYHLNKERYIVINVPPQFMFQAKIFKPSRLCAIFEKQLLNLPSA